MDILNLVNSMTMQEKLAEITQIYISEVQNNGGFIIRTSSDGEKALLDNAGSALGVLGVRDTENVQRHHMEYSSKKIPMFFGEDVIHGYRTIFPSALAISCTWDLNAAEECAETGAREASAAGIHMTFAPMCDIPHDARWGRIVETFGEDPWLASRFTERFVRGFQGGDGQNIDSEHIACCLKHFIGYGAAEGGRDYDRLELGEHELYETYLPSFQAGIDAGAAAVMTCFSALNGVPCTANKKINTEILREQLNFHGVLISDCTAVIELIKHGVAVDNEEAAQQSLSSGVDIEMASTSWYEFAEKLVKEGKISEVRIDEAVSRVLDLKNKIGLLDGIRKRPRPDIEKTIMLCPKHREKARNVARKSLVLLKNDDIFPICKRNAFSSDTVRYKKIHIVGPFADSKRLLDVWSSQGKEEDCVSLYDGFDRFIREKLQTNGLENVGVTCRMTPLTQMSEVEIEQAVKSCEGAELIILALGEDPLWSGESNSRMSIDLPDAQRHLFRNISNYAKKKKIKTAVVLFNGRPLALSEIANNAGAVLEAWYPGTEGGNAIAEVLFGSCNPEGRLTVSFPWEVGQCPIYYNHYNTGRPYDDPMNASRFTSHYIDGPNIPLYPFGYGLTYTTFTYSDIELSSSVLFAERDSSIVASCRITNSGQSVGVETVQLYIRDIAGSYVRPVKMLKSFKKIQLNPGESSRISFEITVDMLKYHTSEGYKAEPGKFLVFISSDSSCSEYKEFTLL